MTRISDGDTIQVRFDDGRTSRVRLIGVNTLERDDPSEEKRCWAEMATRFAAHSLLNRKVRLSYDLEKEDRFGRDLAYVWLDGAEPFNQTLIQEGYSPAYLKYPFRLDYQESFRQAEAVARRSGKGMWGTREPAPMTVSETGSHLGEYVSVRFRCGRLSEGRKYLFLWSDDRRLQALVLKDRASEIMPSGKSYQGKELVATGVLEGDRAFAKIYILFPRQLAVR